MNFIIFLEHFKNKNITSKKLTYDRKSTTTADSNLV